MKDKRLKTSFIKYLEKNPGERFWQAVKNWSKKSFVLTSSHFDPDMFNQKFMEKNDVEITDTFYLEQIKRFEKKNEEKK